MRFLYRCLASFGLAIPTLCSSAALGQACDGTPVNVGGYTVACMGVQYDTPVANQSRWFYTVTSTAGFSAISHTTFSVGLTCLDLVDDGGNLDAGTWDTNFNDITPGDGAPEEVDPDPTTQVSGLKFDEAIPEGTSENYYFTVTGNPAVGPVGLAIKTGPCTGTGPCPSAQVGGPATDCTQCTGLINGVLFLDPNEDGVQDPGEVGLNGHTVGLFNEGDTQTLGTDVSGPLGGYSFSSLDDQNNYEVDVDEGTLQALTPPDGPLFPTLPGIGPVLTGTCQTVDFGYNTLTGAAIGDFVWFDLGNPGVQDANEPGIGGVTVTIIASPGDAFNGQTAETDNFGWYLFTGLTPGTYTVEVDPGTADSDKIAGLPPSQVTKSTVPLSKVQAPGDLEISTSTTVTGDVGDNEFNQAFDFAFAPTSLPVELMAFEASVDDRSVRLSWTTASESNNAGFALEHAGTDGRFAEIAFIDGAGSTVEAHSYAYQVADLMPGQHRFRLKQVDFDGSATYSPEVEVEIEVAGAYVLDAAYPNPFNPQTTLAFAVAEAQQVQVVLHDVLGRPVRVLLDTEIGANASHQVRIDASNLPSGTYLVRFTGETFSTSQRIVLVK